MIMSPVGFSPEMRPVRSTARACLICAIALPLAAHIDKKPLCGLTVILDFKGIHSAASMSEMEREAASIMKSSGVQLEWRMAGDRSVHYDNSLVVMTFRGSCGFGPPSRRYYEPGPYASTKITDGEVQPFGDVDCDRVASVAGDAMAEDTDHLRGDQLVGRALGRVVAHELVHMVTRSNQHGTAGVAKASLSGKELIEECFTLSVPDIERVKKELREH
jgi:hypothetical protein